MTPQDYEQHMTGVGQAQAAARLTLSLLNAAAIPSGGRVDVVGAGTGQLLDFVDAEIFRPFRLTFTDLNSSFLDVLRGRLAQHGLEATVIEDDVEQTRLPSEPDLILAALLLEHIDWRAGVRALTALRPGMCGFVIQENPPGMTSALTPGRSVPTSLAEGMQIAHPVLVPQDQLVAAMAGAGYRFDFSDSVSVADGKHLVSMLFRRQPAPS